MATFESLQKRQDALIRKALAGAVFIAPSTATAITTMTSTSPASLTALPTGYKDLGYLSKDDGATWSRATELSEVTSWGSLEATRSDITSDVTSLAVTAQETNMRTLELYENVDLTGVTPTALTGEISFAKPTRPATRYYRLFAICVDGVGDDLVYVGKFCPRVQVTEIGDQVWTDGDDPIAYPLTFTAKTDTTLGYSVKYYFGGPGWVSQLVAMGFPALAA